MLAEELRRELPRMELIWADGAYTGGFRRWAQGKNGGKKQLRMEFFYREMRRANGLLMEGDEPAGGA